MAIYHCSVKTFSRSDGKSAVAAAAYRARDDIPDEVLGKTHCYKRRKGLEHTEIIVPPNAPNWAKDQNTLWNTVEKTEKRKNSTVAREFEIALPAEFSKEQRITLARDLTRWLVDRFGFAAQFSVHKPDEDDSLNHHVHILASTRKLEAEGFTDKTRELDAMMAAKDEEGNRYNPAILEVRKLVADKTNEHLANAGFACRVDHRSLIDQQAEAAEKNDIKAMVLLAREPTVKVYHGPKEEEAKQQNIEIKQENRKEQKRFLDLIKDAINPIVVSGISRKVRTVMGLVYRARKFYKQARTARDNLDELEHYLKVNGTPEQQQAVREVNQPSDEPRLLTAPEDLRSAVDYVLATGPDEQLRDLGLESLRPARKTTDTSRTSTHPIPKPRGYH